MMIFPQIVEHLIHEFASERNVSELVEGIQHHLKMLDEALEQQKKKTYCPNSNGIKHLWRHGICGKTIFDWRSDYSTKEWELLDEAIQIASKE